MPDEALDALLGALRAGETITGNSPHHEAMHAASQAALRVTARLNGGHHSPEEIVALMRELTGTEVPDSFRLFPPFRTDFGRNTTFGERVFVNSGCCFQDQGGVRIGDDVLIGHNVLIATLNHDLDPQRRADMVPAPVVVGDKVWIGANATILPGVTIGEGAVVGAGSLVTKDVPARTLVVGTPAAVVREL